MQVIHQLEAGSSNRSLSGSLSYVAISSPTQNGTHCAEHCARFPVPMVFLIGDTL
jgi:hypothetical protein